MFGFMLLTGILAGMCGPELLATVSDFCTDMTDTLWTKLGGR